MNFVNFGYDVMNGLLIKQEVYLTILFSENYGDVCDDNYDVKTMIEKLMISVHC